MGHKTKVCQFIRFSSLRKEITTPKANVSRFVMKNEILFDISHNEYSNHFNYCKNLFSRDKIIELNRNSTTKIKTHQKTNIKPYKEHIKCTTKRWQNSFLYIKKLNGCSDAILLCVVCGGLNVMVRWRRHSIHHLYTLSLTQRLKHTSHNQHSSDSSWKRSENKISIISFFLCLFPM